MPYFAATLTAYLRESHPELLSDKHFIAERSDHAAQTYERAVRNGNSVYEALELSINSNFQLLLNIKPLHYYNKNENYQKSLNLLLLIYKHYSKINLYQLH